MLRKTLALAGLAIGGLWAPAGFAQDIVIPNICLLYTSPSPRDS